MKERMGRGKKGSKSKLSGRRALRRVWGIFEGFRCECKAASRKGVKETTEGRGGPLSGEGVSRLNRRERGQKSAGPRMSHCNLQISRMFSGLAAARTNCDYLAEIKKSAGRIHREPRRSNRPVNTPVHI